MVLRGGIIGCGRIVEEGHAPAFLKNSGMARIVAIAGHQDRKRLEIIGKHLEVPETHWYSDYRKMLEKEELDFVDIAVPHFLHEGITVDCVQRGTHVLLEKPMAANLEEADKIISCVGKKGVKLCVLHNYLCQSHHVLALELIREGRIGKPFLMRNEALCSGPWAGARGTDPDWRTRAVKSGGGVLIDNGYHSIYMAEALVDSPIKAVYAKVATYARVMDVDDTAVLALTHENGAVSAIQAAWSVKASQNVNEIYGEKGTIRLSWGDRPVGVYIDKWEYPEVAALDWGFDKLFKDFFQSLSDDKDPPVTGEEGRRTLKIITAGYESARTGKEVHV